VTKKMEKMVKPRIHGQSARWIKSLSTKHSMEWQPVEPKLVAEVQSITSPATVSPRHKILAWRPEKDPQQCTMKQVQRENRRRWTYFEAQPIASDHSRKLGGLGAVACPRRKRYVFSSTPSRTQRSISPPRLMSPRPANSSGNTRPVAKMQAAVPHTSA